jgi:phage recombination protein Bet
MSVIAAPAPRQLSIIAAMADRYSMMPEAFEKTLRATVFPSTGSKEEFAAFLMVCKQYDLDPILKEIYAFPKRGGGIQPIVSLDGWARIINSHPAFDGMEFIDHQEKGVVTAITCRIHRKDRSHPIEATEYLSECFRQTEPWQKWPRRMLRHKALIQAARYAFGFAGIVDPDEAERFTERRAPQPPAPPTSMKQLADKLSHLAQPRPPEPAPAPPQPRPPQPGGDDEDWPPEEEDEDHGPDKDEPDNSYDTLEEKRMDQEPPKDTGRRGDEEGEEIARLQDVGQEKALQGSKKLRWWRARLRPEQEARINWAPLEAAAKAADAG